MTQYERLITELVCHAHGAHIVDIKENIAVDAYGQLIREAHVTAIKIVPIEEITVTISTNPLG